MTENKYFVTRTCGSCICKNISRKKENNLLEYLTYQDIVDSLNKKDEKITELKKRNQRRKRKIKRQRTVLDELGAVILGYKNTVKLLKKDKKKLEEERDYYKSIVDCTFTKCKCGDFDNE